MRYSKIVVVGLVALCALSCSRFRKQKPLPVIGTIPSFAFVDQDDASFTSDMMVGKTWVVDFIFTRCTTSCPRLTQELSSVQLNFPNEMSKIGFLSITVDPQYDKPKQLKAYMARFGLDETNWRFVTGDVDVVKDAVVRGFKVALGESDPNKKFDIVHAEHFVLVDDKQQIRGYYSSDRDGMTRLVEDARRLTGGDIQAQH